MGEADDLRSHYYIVYTLVIIGQAYVFSAVVKDRGDLEEQPLSLPEPVDLPGLIEYLDTEFFNMLHMLFRALVAFGDHTGSGNDILLKLVDPVPRGIAIILLVRNAGSVFYRNGKFSVTNVCGLLKILDKSVNIKFMY